jgi:hypothetical protein
MVKLVAVGDASQDQQTSGDQLTPEVAAWCGEPESGQGASLLGTEVVASVGEVGQLVEQRLQGRVLDDTARTSPTGRTQSPRWLLGLLRSTLRSAQVDDLDWRRCACFPTSQTS